MCSRRLRASHCLFVFRTLIFGAALEDGQAGAVSPINAFTFQQQLSAPDAVPNDEFGDSVALSGNTAIVGAPVYPSDGTPRGAAYVFVRNGDIWTFQAKLVPNDSTPGMRFGSEVAISGNFAVVGAPSHDIAGRTDAGAAYVFRRSGNLWQQEARLVGDSAAVRFGQDVAIDGNLVVVGSDDEEQRGAVFLFLPGGTANPGEPTPWIQRQKLLAPNGQPGDDFGESVAVRGNTIIAGAKDARLGGVSRGTVYVFDEFRLFWSVSAEIVAADGQAGDDFGASVAFDGLRAMIAAPQARLNGVSSGAAYVFLRQGIAWSFEQKLTPDVPRTDTDFGLDALAIDGALAVAGIAESTTRQAFMFRFSGGTWTREVVDPAATSRLQSLALLGTVLLVGNDHLGAAGTVEVLLDQDDGAPLVPPLLAAVVTGSTVNLTWNAVPTATRYQLRAGTFPGGSNAFDGDVGTTTALVATNVPNGTYFIRVHAVQGNTESAASNEVRVDVGTGPCQIPAAASGLTFSRAGFLVTLSWAAVTNATSYILEAGSSSGASNIIVIDTGNASTQLMGTAPPGTYFVRVRGKNACGVGPASSEVVITVS